MKKDGIPGRFGGGEMKVRKQANKVLQTKIAVQTTMPIGTVRHEELEFGLNPIHSEVIACCADVLR
jgi:hypothetical protein